MQCHNRIKYIFLSTGDVDAFILSTSFGVYFMLIKKYVWQTFFVLCNVLTGFCQKKCKTGASMLNIDCQQTQIIINKNKAQLARQVKVLDDLNITKKCILQIQTTLALMKAGSLQITRTLARC